MRSMPMNKFSPPYKPGEEGDCARCAIAYVLDMERDDVPHFLEGTDKTREGADLFWTRMTDWMWANGRSLELRFWHRDLSSLMKAMLHGFPDELWVLAGTSRTGSNHAVACRGGRIVHDSNASGIVDPIKHPRPAMEKLAMFASRGVRRRPYYVEMFPLIRESGAVEERLDATLNKADELWERLYGSKGYVERRMEEQ